MNSRVSPPAFISRQVVEARRFYHDGCAAMAKRFAVVCGGWERCAADYRMNHAAALLEGGHRLVREAADAFGLDPYHFSRVFKRVHGLSPTAFLRHREAGIDAERVG